jgi:hypothetical protein
MNARNAHNPQQSTGRGQKRPSGAFLQLARRSRGHRLLGALPGERYARSAATPNRPSLKMPLILRVCPRSIAQYADAMACLGRILLWTKVTLPPPELTETYAWDDRSIAFHRCRRCGCVSHWLPVARPEDRKGGERTADGPGHRRASAHSTPRRGGVRTGCRLRESHCRATMVQMGTNALLVLRTKLIGHLYSFR